MAISRLIPLDLSVTPTISLIIISAIAALLLHLFNKAFLSSLSAIPGPILSRFSSLPLWYHTYIGDECSYINSLHSKNGPVVRIAPNDIVISDGAALAPIYSEKGGFLKADCYKNFDFDGHATMFSALDIEHRAKRSKAVIPLFSTASIRARQEVFEDCAERFASKLKQESRNGKVVDILTMCRRVALESVSCYLFDTNYGSLDEQGDELSAAAFVDAAVAIGKFFLLPNWLFLALEQILPLVAPVSQQEKDRLDKVDSFGASLAATTTETDSTFQGRLKKVGISDSEIAVQCKDLVFAGTDSTGTALANTCWWLCKKPDVYQKLKDEIAEADAADPTLTYNPQGLFYLDAVVKEGLRLAQPNPTRFPRVVPPNGWRFTATTGKSYFLPAGTVVGCQSATLHFNPDVFNDPTDFNPDRWTKPTAEMQRDFIPFNVGSRQCIARNMAYHELLVNCRMLARHNTLDGAEVVTQKLKVVQWFNSKLESGKIEFRWS